MILDLCWLFGIFCAGLVTTLLAMGRTLALVRRRERLLYCLTFTEDLVVLLIGMWLARCGTIPDAVACALGSVTAAAIILIALFWIFMVGDGVGKMGY